MDTVGTYICEIDCEMFDSVKVMVSQRDIHGNYGGSCKKGSVIQLMLKINTQNLAAVAL